MSNGEEFEIDVGEVGGDKQQWRWRPLPRLIHGRQELRRLLSDIADLLLNSATVVYLAGAASAQAGGGKNRRMIMLARAMVAAPATLIITLAYARVANSTLFGVGGFFVLVVVVPFLTFYALSDR